MGNPKNIKRNFVALERRRMKALMLLKQGHSKAEVARRLHVSNQSVGRWHMVWKLEGATALKYPGRAGRRARLQRSDWLYLKTRLLSGAKTTLGYATDQWTLLRVAKLIEICFGHKYSVSQISRSMRTRGLSGRKPNTPHPERNKKKSSTRNSAPANGNREFLMDLRQNH